MFVVKLVEENLELVKSELSKILYDRPSHAKYFEVNRICEDGVVFRIDNCCDHEYILVEDFKISNLTGNEIANPEVQNKLWRRFMINMYGAKYFEALTAERAKQKRNYIKKHNEETKEMLYDLSKYSNCDIGHNR